MVFKGIMNLGKIFFKKAAIIVLAAIGIVTTIKLAVIYYNSNFNPYALSSFCSINEFIDCDGIAKTTEAQFLGIPLAYWGMFFYAFVILMLFVDKLKNIKLFKFLEVFKHPLDYIASLGLISFVISMVLLCISLFTIKKLCILCALTYVINLLIGIIAADFKNGGFVQSIKQSFTDFLDAVKIKKYLAAFIAVMLIAAGFLAYTRITYVFAPQVKRHNEFKEFTSAKANKYAVSGNVLGDKDGKFIVYTYTDYRCPICFAHNIMIHKLAKELKGFKVIHRNLPLDMECNKYLQAPFHEGSCKMARYALAAKKQGKFWDINSLFFEKKPVSEAEIMKIAKKLNLDTEKLYKDANSPEIAKKLTAEIDGAYARGINATPTTLIGRDAYIGIKSYNEYKKILIEAGAEERK